MRLSRRELAAGTAGLVAARSGGVVSAPLELWSWTTTEQAAELKAGGPLFTRSERPGKGPGYAFEFLNSLKDDATAKLLTSARFAKGRYAWINPWATCLGFGAESYGTELIRIELKPGSTLVPCGSYRGRPLPAAGDPALVAGFSFTNDSIGLGTTVSCSSFGGNGGWREVFVGDANRVARWTMGTKEIAARLERDITYLSGLARAFKGEAAPGVCAWLDTVKRAWRDELVSTLPEYDTQLAFAAPAYYPTSWNLERMVKTLQSRLP